MLEIELDIILGHSIALKIGGDTVTLKFAGLTFQGDARLGIEAPRRIQVDREEIHRANEALKRYHAGQEQ